MRLIYNGSKEQIKIACDDANEVLNTKVFYDSVEKYQKFSCSNLNGIQISEIIQNSNLIVEIKLYTPRWIYSSVNGYFSSSFPNYIFLNSRKIFRDSASLSNTIIHEYIHALDYEFNKQKIDFGHSCDDLSNTAPYLIGEIAEEIINGLIYDKNILIINQNEIDTTMNVEKSLIIHD